MSKHAIVYSMVNSLSLSLSLSVCVHVCTCHSQGLVDLCVASFQVGLKLIPWWFHLDQPSRFASYCVN